MKRVSIKIIAEKLGISVGTVSDVLNGKAEERRISKELTQKIVAVAQEMKYQPNEVARSLRAGRTKTIGVIMADISNEFFGTLAFFIQSFAKQSGYSVIIANTNESLSELEDLVKIFINRHVDGIIIVPTENSENIVNHILSHKIPLVLLDRYYPSLNTSYVVLDNYNTSARLVKRLTTSGCKMIAFLHHKIQTQVTVDRLAGYVDTVKKLGTYDPSLIKEIKYQNNEAEIKKAILDLKKGTLKVDAVLFYSGKLFISGVTKMLESDIRIPSDMKVACIDKVGFSSILSFPIIYAQQPMMEMAEKSVDILLKQIENYHYHHQCNFPASIGSSR